MAPPEHLYSVSAPGVQAGVLEIRAPMTGRIVSFADHSMVKIIVNQHIEDGLVIHSTGDPNTLQVLVSPITGTVDYYEQYAGFQITDEEGIQVHVYFGVENTVTKNFTRLVKEKSIVKSGEPVAQAQQKHEIFAMMLFEKSALTQKMQMHKWTGEVTAGGMLWYLMRER